MKVKKYTEDVEEYLQQLIDADEPLLAGPYEVGLTKRKFEALRSKYDLLEDFGDPFGEYFI